MHIPVLLNEVIELLNPKPGEFFIDGTLGGGGHAEVILEKISPNGKLLAIDWDKNAIEAFKKKMKNQNVVLMNDNYANLPEILKRENIEKADGLLLDLGLSSDQLENSGRGFSFQKDEPLLMTYDQETKPVREILRDITEWELAEIIKNYGEERFAKKIAAAIKERGKTKTIGTSAELAEIIKNAVPKRYQHGRIHPATRTFMALRVYANRELDNIEKILKNLFNILKPGGRAAVISFHSLEDRLVKNYFRNFAKENRMEILTKKPITPSQQEIEQNPRARSAKLRAAKIL